MSWTFLVGAGIFLLCSGGTAFSSWYLNPRNTPTTYKVICSIGSLLAGIIPLTLYLMSSSARASLLVLLVLFNLLWRPARGIIRLLLAINRGRRRHGINKHETLLVFFLTVLLVISAVGASRVFFPQNFLGYRWALAPKMALQLWFHGLPVLRPLAFAYIYLSKTVFSSTLFFHQVIPFYFVWTVLEWGFWCHYKFNRFLDLGRGASPPTFRGWATAYWRAWFANVDVLSPPRVNPMADPYRGRLSDLPHREGPRPIIEGQTPQRLTSLRAAPGTMLQLEAEMADLIANQFNGSSLDAGDIAAAGDLISIRLSYLERGLPALRRNLDNALNPDDIRVAVNPNDFGIGPTDAEKPRSFGTRNEWGGEIYHPHRDGTSHVVLHPEDVRVVLESGWGERHPFACESFYWRFYWSWFLNLRLPVPPGLVILYPPRHQGEFDLTRSIMEAAVWHETRGALFTLRADTEPIAPAPDAAAAAPAPAAPVAPATPPAPPATPATPAPPGPDAAA